MGEEEVGGVTLGETEAAVVELGKDEKMEEGETEDFKFGMLVGGSATTHGSPPQVTWSSQLQLPIFTSNSVPVAHGKGAPVTTPITQ